MWFAVVCTALVQPRCPRHTAGCPRSFTQRSSGITLVVDKVASAGTGLEQVDLQLATRFPAAGSSAVGPDARGMIASAEIQPVIIPQLRRGPLLRALLCTCVLGQASATSFAADAPIACIDVDSAAAKDLESLKGVGPAISKRIIDYRKAERTSATKDGRQTWNFNNWATLMKVEGVSQQLCADNIAQVCFGGKVQKACPMPK